MTTPQPLTAVEIAAAFHETYERLAPRFGYTTREDTRAFNSDSPNGRLMIAVCEELAPRLLSAARQQQDELFNVTAERDALRKRLEKAERDNERRFNDGVAAADAGYALLQARQQQWPASIPPSQSPAGNEAVGAERCNVGVGEVIAGLAKYGNHTDGCATHRPYRTCDPPPTCDCGWASFKHATGILTRDAKQEGPWVPLQDLRDGAIFETQSGIRAVKSGYHYSNAGAIQCVLLESGEYAHFCQTPGITDYQRAQAHNLTLVREIELPQAASRGGEVGNG
jgi:hypothetical protein